jgi:hypothetical protein
MHACAHVPPARHYAWLVMVCNRCLLTCFETCKGSLWLLGTVGLMQPDAFVRQATVIESA